MGGVILENLSGRKLAILVAGLLLCQLACFLIGGCIAPAPYNTMQVLGTKCVTHKYSEKQQWFFPRGKPNQVCDVLHDFKSERVEAETITPNDVVFAFQLPLPRGGVELHYSRWFQNLMGILHLDISYSEKNPIVGNPKIMLDVKMGYQNEGDDGNWHLLAKSYEERTLDCSLESEKEKKEGHFYKCPLLPLFELGSVHHENYLINIRVPVSDKNSVNENIGNLVDVWLIAINQNGGFTMIWVSLKTFFFPFIIGILIWFWRRIRMLQRPPALLEKMLFALGLGLTQLNVPIEYLTLYFNMPFMLLLSDIRQGIFYATLLSFWLVFAGEHMMDEIERNQLNAYWKHLSAVVFGCLCLFVFDMCERGVQLKNPFYSIWVTELGTNLALTFIILAGISACIYFLFLSYMIFQVFRNIKYKALTISSMSNARRIFYQGIVYRFKFLMLATLLCAALTVISFIIGQVAEGRWKWDEDIHLEYTSAVVCGVYGMWNIYVFALIVLYAPSHKHWPDENGDARTIATEEIECSHLLSESRSEGSALTTLAKKVTVD